MKEKIEKITLEKEIEIAGCRFINDEEWLYEPIDVLKDEIFNEIMRYKNNYSKDEIKEKIESWYNDVGKNQIEKEKQNKAIEKELTTYYMAGNKKE